MNDWSRDPLTGAIRIPHDLPAVTSAPCYKIHAARAAAIYTARDGNGRIVAEIGACHAHRNAALRWAQARGQVTEQVLDGAGQDGQAGGNQGQGVLFDDTG